MLTIYYADTAGLDLNAAYTLSEYRRERLAKFRFDQQKRESLGAELLLNMALSEYCPALPLPVEIRCSEYGKPEIPGCPLFFNLSHSEGTAACAICDSPVGLDIQYRDQHSEGIAKRFFARAEQQYISASSDPEAAFTDIWCQKESFVKALGTGLQTPFESFSVIGKDIIWQTRLGRYHLAVCTPQIKFPHPEMREIVFPVSSSTEKSV